MLARRECVRELLAAQVRVPAGQRRAHRLDDAGSPRRRQRTGSARRRRGRDDRRRALRPDRSAARRRSEPADREGSRRAGGRRVRADPRAGHAAHAADRDLRSLVARRQDLPVARVARGDECARARRRCAVGRRARDRRRRGGLLHDQRPEVAVRARCDRGALRARPGLAAPAARRVPERRDVRHRRGHVGAEGGCAALRHDVHAGVVARRPRSGAHRPAGGPLRACAGADGATVARSWSSAATT